MTAFIEPIQDATGSLIFKVHTFCGNAAHAQATVRAINSVPPASAFVPVQQLTPSEAMQELVAESERLGLYDTAQVIDALQLSDDDYKNPAEPPRCATGACGLD